MQGSKEVIKSSGTYAWHEGDGLCRTIYGEAWQYMVLPNQPSVHDAAGWSDRERAAQPIKTIMTRVAEVSRVRSGEGRGVMAHPLIDDCGESDEA